VFVIKSFEPQCKYSGVGGICCCGSGLLLEGSLDFNAGIGSHFQEDIQEGTIGGMPPVSLIIAHETRNEVFSVSTYGPQYEVRE
jgi:hypothetical protein